MFKFEGGVLCYCDAGSYQKSNQVRTLAVYLSWWCYHDNVTFYAGIDTSVVEARAAHIRRDRYLSGPLNSHLCNCNQCFVNNHSLPQVAADIPTVMLGKCQYFHVGCTAVCQSEPDMDNVDKCQFVFR